MILPCRFFSVSRSVILVAVGVVVLGCGVNTRAQTSRVGATLEGTVSDTTGAVLANARVTLRNPLTNQSRSVVTDERGFFRAEQLAVGGYEVQVELAGFASYRQAGVELSLGQTVHLDITLALASASEQVTVNAQSSALDASQTSVVSTVDQERIEELPVRSRNYLDFVLLAPGVANSPVSGSAAGGTPLAGSGFTFGGLRARSNSVSIDGLDNNDEYTGSSRTELSPEIVEEFQVVNQGLSAESGGASGGSINVITRSGSNVVHGDTFIFAQDSALNARDPFESESGKPSFRRFRSGLALGGPVVKNQTFYYGAVEQEHNRGEIGSGIDPAAAASINGFLETGANARLTTRRITTGFAPLARAETEAAIKIDHELTKNTALMLRYSFTNNKESGDAFHTNRLMDASARGSSFTSDNALSGSLTTALGSKAVSDLRFQAATRHAVLRTDQAFGPEIDIAGVATFGRPYAGNSARRENQYQVSYTYARTAGKHLWKMGGTVNRVGLRAAAPDGFGGAYLFRNVADFLAGQPGQFRQAFGTASVDLPVTSFGGFVQDHWIVTRNVVLDAGARYDFEKLPADFNQDTNNFSPRIGLAWNPSAKWVFRGGFGVFFDRYVLANLARAEEKNGLQGFEQVADGNEAAGMFAGAQGGPLTAPTPGIIPSIYRADPGMATSYSEQASAGAEYLLAKNLTVRADYLFVRGVKLGRTVNVNLLPPVVLTAANAPGLGVPNPTPQQIGREVFSPGRQNGEFADIYQLQNSASSMYKGFSLTLSRRVNEELEFSGSYTVSEANDDASEFDEQPQNPFALAAEKVRSRQDQQQRFVFNALWDLPIGDEEDNGGKTDRNEGWATRAFRHIEVAPIFTAASGRPVNPLTGMDSNESHAYPLSARPLGFGRNSLKTPRTVTMDFRVLKYFPFGESRHLDVVAEFFNLLNHANVAQINPVFGSGAESIAGFKEPIEGTGARQVQFSLDFEF
jgi:Carboxypeptidase regulatory-like domain/TonB dependent receptor-like, beta-barrel/TonB-dependent Receptor Plug Domain